MLIKLELFGYRMVENYDDMLNSRFYLIPKRNGRTDRQSDGQTDEQICYINQKLTCPHCAVYKF